MARAVLAARVSLVLVVVSGCASLDGLSEGEKGSPSRAPKSSSTALLGCDPKGAFTTAVPLASGGTAFGARWDAKKTTVVFNTGRGQNVELRIGSNFDDATGAAFGPLAPPDGGALTPLLVFPSISNDGLFLYYQAYSPAPDAMGGGDSVVYRARRTTTSEPFHDYEPVVHSSSNDFGPYLVASANALYWTHADPSSATMRVMRFPVGAAEDPKSVFEASSSVIANAVVSSDEKSLYYADERGGTMDIYVATRASLSDEFTNGKPFDSLNSAAHAEIPSWISDDQCELVYEKRDFDSDTHSLWSARR